MTLQLPTLDPCPFCRYVAGTDPCVFVVRTGTVSAFLNRTQYERGALLVVPDRHVSTLLDASEAEVAEVARVVRVLARAVEGALGATGITVFQNNGVPSGQTVPHFHTHLVPRYPGSTAGRIFRERDFEITPLATLEEIASSIRGALDVTPR
ncbi:MAG: HIT family protein [Phycisphaerales bacterium JB038]